MTTFKVLYIQPVQDNKCCFVYV